MELPDAVRTAFETAPHCFLATCHSGVPNVVPVGRKWIVGNDILLADFHFGKTFEKLAAMLRDAGVDAEPHAAVLVSVAEVYLLDPGPNAGKRVL